MVSKKHILAICLCPLWLTATAQADVTFNFGQGDLAASATFSVAGDTLFVTLENTATVDVVDPVGVLTGLFFDINGFGGSLTRVSALLTNIGGNTPDVLFGAGLGTAPFLGYNHYAGVGDVGSEAGYRIGASVLNAATGDHAIGVVGMDDFMGVPTRFDLDDSHNLQGPVAPNGIEYGLVNSSYLGGGNAPINGPNALMRNALLLTFTGFSGFTEGDIENVAFNYGTEFNPIPAPGAAMLGLIGLASIGWMRPRA